jgi:uncharacterized integral membrane protein
MRLRLILIAVVVALTAVFVAQNTEPVEVRLFLWSVVMSRALMFLAVLSVGVLIGWGLHSLTAYRRRHHKDRRLRGDSGTS